MAGRSIGSTRFCISSKTHPISRLPDIGESETLTHLPETCIDSMNTQVSIERAELRHVDEIAPLFDAYRDFYGRTYDPLARSFLEERVARHESVVFVARLQGAAIGFTQLYPCFASVSLARMFVLYDLFVAPQARRCGAAAALLRAGVDYAAGQGAGQLMLQTGVSNLSAQRLYEREGWVRDRDFYVYEYHLPTGERA
jgi:GNAT superfamily N-acetyltransferase